MRKLLTILLSLTLFAPSAFAQTEDPGITDGSENTEGAATPLAEDGTTPLAEDGYLALPVSELRQPGTTEDGHNTYVVELNWQQGRLYNDVQPNGRNTTFLARWFCYDHPTLSVNAVHNNISLGGSVGCPIQPDANGNIPVNIYYGRTHDPITVTAPRGWKLTKVTMDGHALKAKDKDVATAKVVSVNGRAQLNGESEDNRAALGWDAVASTLGYYRQEVSSDKYENGGQSDFGTVYAYFLPESYDWPTNPNSNETNPTGTPAEYLKAQGYNVNHFEWTPEAPTDHFTFHLNGDNTGIQAFFQIHIEQCDSVEGVKFHVLDGNNGNKELTPDGGLIRTLRKSYNGEATVPQDFDRDFCNYTWCDASGNGLTAAVAATDVTSGSDLYLKLTRSTNYPFRIANIPEPEGEDALTTESSSSDLRSAGFYYVSIGNDRFFKAATDNAIQIENETADQSNEWFAFVKGDAFNGWKIVNFDNTEKFLTMESVENMGPGKTCAEATNYDLSFKSEPATDERNLWIPLSARFNHVAGHTMNNDNPVLEVAMHNNAFFLVPVKASAKDFAQDYMRWHLTALKKTDDGLVARTGKKGRFSGVTDAYVNDERDEKSRILLHEITDVDVRVINGKVAEKSDTKKYDAADVWVDFSEGLKLKHLRELQELTISQASPVVRASKVCRDFCTFTNTVTGTAADQLYQGETTDEGGNVTINGGKTLFCNFELFNITPEADKDNPTYKYFIKAAPRLTNKNTGGLNNSYLYNNGNTTIQATTDGLILPNEKRKDNIYRWFFTGTPYKGFVCHSMYTESEGAGHKALLIESGNFSLVDESELNGFALRPDSAYTRGLETAQIAEGDMTYDSTLRRGAEVKGGALMRQCFNIVGRTIEEGGVPVSTYLKTAWPSLRLNASGTDNEITNINSGELTVRRNGADALSEFILVPAGEDIHHFILRKKGDDTNMAEQQFTVTSENEKVIDLNDASMGWLRDYCIYTCTTTDLENGDPVEDSDKFNFTLPADRADKGTTAFGTSQRALTYTLTGTGSNANLEHVIEWEWDGPFKLSTETEKNWYLLKRNAAARKTGEQYYVLANNFTAADSYVSNEDWNNGTIGDSYRAMSLNYGGRHVLDGLMFAFIGDPYSGFLVEAKKGGYLRADGNQRLSNDLKRWFVYENAPRPAAATDDYATTGGNFDKRFAFREVQPTSTGGNRYRFMDTYTSTDMTLDTFYSDDNDTEARKYNKWSTIFVVEDPRPTLKTFFDHFLEAPKGTVYGMTDYFYDTVFPDKSTYKVLTEETLDHWYDMATAVRTFADYDGHATRNLLRKNSAYRIISVNRALNNQPAYVSMHSSYNDRNFYTGQVADEAAALKNPSTVFVTGNWENTDFDFTRWYFQRVRGGMYTQGKKVGPFTEGNIALSDKDSYQDESAQLNQYAMLINAPSVKNKADKFVKNNSSPYAVLDNQPNAADGNDWYVKADAADGKLYAESQAPDKLASCFYLVPATEFKGTISERLENASFFLDFPVKVPEGYKAWYVSSVTHNGDGTGEAEQKFITAGNVIAPHTPFLLTPDGGAYGEVTFTIPESSETPVEITDNKLSGVYLPIQKADAPTSGNEIVYTFGQETTTKELGFHKYNGSTLGANKIFALFDPTIAGSFVRLWCGDDGNMTHIGSIESEKTDSAIYDMQGRRVANPTRNGLYIVNGKKVYLNTNN